MALIDKASLLMVPSTYEAGTLYNVLPSGNRAPDSTDQNSGYDQTRADFTFDRGSNAAATRVNADGLIEKYRENLLLQSNQFDTTWTIDTSTASITSGQADKDGGTDAWSLVAKAVNGHHRIIQTFTGAANNVVTFSVFAKANGYNFLRIIENATTGDFATFDLSDGSVANTTGISNTATIEAVSGADGWYRCSIAFDCGATTRFDIYTMATSGTTSFVGDGVSGAYIMNAQAETGLVATDYLDSGATTAKAGVLIDLPRINYDANGENGALLLEPSRANLVQYSEYFGDSSWSKTSAGTGSNAVVTNNYGISPEGFKNASRLQLNLNGGTTGSDISYIADYYTATGAATTNSIYMKSLSGTSNVRIRCGSTFKSVDVTTDWQRFDVTDSSGSDRFQILIYGGINSDTADLLIWGAQAESSASYPTSYIPNHGTSGGVTRAADSCSVTGVSDVIGQTEGTLYIEFDHRYMASYPNEYIIDIEDSTHKLWIRKESAGNTLTSRLIVSGSNVWTIGISATDGIAKIALAYKSGDSAVYYNGTQIGTSSATYSGSSFDDIYFNLAGSANPELKAKNLTLFKERLSNAELAALTA